MTALRPIWTREHLAWVAGVIEGDGCLTLKQGRPVISVVMTDEDVLLRLKEWTGLGTVYGPYLPPNGHNKKPLYTWAVGSAPHTYALAVAIFPWLGDRRRQRAIELIRRYVESPPCNAGKTHCKHNHKFSKENTYYYDGQRKCRQCRATTSRRYREKVKA